MTAPMMSKRRGPRRAQDWLATGALLSYVLLLASCSGGGPEMGPRRFTLSASPSNDTVDDLYRFFAIAFSAAPGLTYLQQMMSAVEGGASVRQIVRTFTTKSQFTDLYPVGMSDRAFAQRLTENVVGDSASAAAKREAVEDIVAALALPSMTRGDVVYVVFKNLAAKLPSDYEWGNTARRMTHQVAYARHYTEVIRGDTLDADVLRRVLAGADQNAEITPSAMDAAIRTAIAAPAAFSSLPQEFPNLRDYFVDMCGQARTGHNIQNIIPVDLNQDGRKDLLLTIWCSPRPNGGVFEGPTPARVLAFIQGSDGRFTEQTREVFGAAVVDIGGVNEYWAATDLNGDGYTDILLSLQREDGRTINTPFNAQWTRNLALISQGDGRYRTEAFGEPAWNFPIILKYNARGTQDVIATNASMGVQAFTYDGGFKPITGLEWARAPAGVFLPGAAPGRESTRAIYSVYDSLVGVESWVLSDGVWRTSGRFGYEVRQVQKLCCGNAAPSGAVMVTVEGKDYLDASFGFSCLFRRTPSSPAEVLLHFNAQEIVGGYRGQVLVYGESALVGTDRILSFGFALDGVSLEVKPLQFRGEVPRPMEPNGMSCRDYNGDGLQDVLLTRSKRSVWPTLYLNDGAGGMDLVAASPYPAQRATEGLMNYVLDDLDGDGVIDFIYHPIVSNSEGYVELRPLIHKGKRPLGAGDRMR